MASIPSSVSMLATNALVRPAIHTSALFIYSHLGNIKKLLKDAAFLKAGDDLNRRTLGLLVGLPVRDHRAAAHKITPQTWRDVEETVDSFARQWPRLTLAIAVWQRSFPQFTGKNFLAA